MEIDYDRVRYVTNRKLADKKGEKKGHILMYSYDGLNFHYKMKCPYCENEEEKDVVLKRRPYRILCGNCGKKILVEKLLKK